VSFLEDFVQLVGSVAGLKEWGAIAFLLLTVLYQLVTSRKDRNKARSIELEREKYVANLLEHRHDRYESVFERSTEVVAQTRIALSMMSGRLEDVEDKINSVDSKCTARQKKWMMGGKEEEC